MKDFYQKHRFFKKSLQITSVLLFLFINNVYAATRTSVQSGDWNNSSTWGCFNCVPKTNDDVIISSGHTVSLFSGATTVGSLTIQTSGDFFQIADLMVRNFLTIDGLHSGSGNLSLSGNNFIVDGIGTVNNTGILFLNHNTIIAAACSITKNSGNVQISSNRTLTNYGIFRILGGNLIGGNTSSTWTNEANSILEIGGDLLTTGTVNAIAIGNKIIYSGGSLQIIKFADYFNLEINKTTTTTAAFGGNTTILNNFTIINGIAESGPYSLTVNGQTDIYGRLNLTSATGAKIFNNINIASSGFFNCTTSLPVTFNGNLINNGSFTSNTGVYTLNGTAKSISGSNPVQVTNLDVTGSYTNNGSIIIINSFYGSGTFSQGIGSNLILEVALVNFTVASLNASATGNRVSYNANVNQIVRALPSGYHHLDIAGSGIKSPEGNLTIFGNLTISSTLNGTLLNYLINLHGEWNNTGTFNPGNSTVVFSGANQNIFNPSSENFYNIIFSGSGIKALNTDITVFNNLEINSTLDVSTAMHSVNVKSNWINNGTFLPRIGTVYFNGASAQQIGGNALTTFSNINVNNISGVSLSNNSRITGTLSVVQGTFNTAGFNFTLVSNSNGTARIASLTAGDVVGDVIMERYLAPGQNDWRFLSSAVSGKTLNDWKDDFIMSGFTGSQYPNYGFISMYTYNESVPGLFEIGYVAATNITNPLTSGKGFWAYIGPTPLTIDVKGPIHKGLVSLPVSYTPSAAGPNHDGWCMVGNPYPSSINWDAPGWIKNNVSNAVYIWNSSNQQYAVYQGGLGINGGSRFIGSSQGFWVQTYGPSPSLSLTESVKAPNDAFLRTTSNNLNILKLSLVGNGYVDETVLNFDENFSFAFEPNIDAKKLFSFNTAVPSLVTIADSIDLSINCLPGLSSSISI
ncbi:MAG: hypothetical protein M3Q58_03870, partial [Bacteroidota bacterium]|nr:hypothetical protein [Bacteroidota bacterium]